MSRYVYMLTLALVLGLSAPAIAQDAPADEATETTDGKPTLKPGTAVPAPADLPGTEAGDDDDSAAGDDDDSAAVVPPFVPDKEPENIEEGISFLVKAIESKSWPVVVGLILSIIVMVLNQIGLKQKVGKKAVPWIAMALSVAGTIGSGLAIGTDIAPAIMQGVLTGTTSIAFWELMTKHVFRKDKKDEPKPA